jgi:hypothetical protein
MARDFIERMEAGKTLAMDRRNRGHHTGKSAKGWDVAQRRPLEWWEQRIEETRLRFHAALDAARLLQVPPQSFDPETDIPF